MELILLVVAGWFVLRLVNRRRGPDGACEHRFGWLKLIGLAAVVAGVSVFWARSQSHHEVEVDDAFAHDTYVAFEPLDLAKEFHVEHHGPWRTSPTVTVETTPSWAIICLGSVLVILGVLIFTRGRLKPAATSIMTLLGVGAIVFAVASYVGDPPRSSSPAVERQVAVRGMEEHHIERHVTRGRHDDASRSYFGRAKRPALRPVRPTGEEQLSGDELPPRAGSIPVAHELAKANSSDAAPAPDPSAATDATPPAAALAAAESENDNVGSDAVEQEVENNEDAHKDKHEDDGESAEAEHEEDNVSDVFADVFEDLVQGSGQRGQRPGGEHEAAQVAALESNEEDEAPTVAVPDDRAATDEATAAGTIDLARPRPDWIDAPSKLNGSTYLVVVRSGRFGSVPECQHELDEQMKEAVDHYVAQYLGDEQAASLVDVPLSFIKRNLRKDQWAETVETKALEGLNLGEMYEMYARLQFDENAQHYFHRQWHDAEVTRRLWYAGGGAALLLALLSTFYGYLQLDMRTGGAHKGRLQLAATLVALIVAAGVLVARRAMPF
ncbi:MAG: hypothetical protein DWQ37_17390 [Planctomycetota bacterium]|nr:MAG: hypothetical protein DWQ37_17390 [Planctomycetota bacterium]